MRVQIIAEAGYVPAIAGIGLSYSKVTAIVLMIGIPLLNSDKNPEEIQIYNVHGYRFAVLKTNKGIAMIQLMDDSLANKTGKTWG